MSIWQKAYETYENHAHRAGMEYAGEKQPLTPVGFIIQKAQIEIALKADGTFDSAEAVGKDACKTMIPATEASAARTVKAVPHPLCEQLSYLMPGSGERYEAYRKQLSDWASSPSSTPKVAAVLAYVQGNTIVQDLNRAGLVKLAEDGSILPEKVEGTEPEKCMIRWRVYNAGAESAVWKDPELFAAWRDYLEYGQAGAAELCMIDGSHGAIATSHPKGTIALSYGAKLISANDNVGFTYRGRFTEPEQAASVGYLSSQKVHSALQWLAANQGVVLGGRTFLCWNPKGKPVVKVYDPFEDLDGVSATASGKPSDYKDRLKKTLLGWRKDLPDEEDVVIASLEAATTGRLSITHYSEMKASDYHQRLYNWYDTCCMRGRNGVGSPTLADIVRCAYGVERGKLLAVDDKIFREHFQRLLYCVTEGAAIPADLVKALRDRASRPLCFKEMSNRGRTQFTACAVLRKYLNDQIHKEEWTVQLDEKQSDRSYLYGRMLAVMEYVERSTYGRDEAREPNAIRMQTVFCERPLDTAMVLEKRLEPYFRKLSPGQRVWCKNKIAQIHGLFRPEDWEAMNRPLDGRYLLGYYHQRTDLYQKKENSTFEEE